MQGITKHQPLGIFDSGIGGLSVARAVIEQLPRESIVYFGDTAHLPYGEQSVHTIRKYVEKIVDFLLVQNVKLILVACNSASVATYQVLQDYVAGRAIIIDVVDPVVNYLSKYYSVQRVGFIGTRLTVESQVYQHRMAALAPQIDFCALATPLFVPIIEENFLPQELDRALTEYLTHSVLQNIDALVLGCTHYPVIKKSIAKFYNNKVPIIDVAEIVASVVKHNLVSREILATAEPQHHFYISEHKEKFVQGARLFFGEAVEVQVMDIF